MQQQLPELKEEEFRPALKRVMDNNEPGYIRQELFKVGWEQFSLITGDYYFFTHDYKKVGIERKTVEDLLGSLGDRLTRQLENSLEHYDRVILLVEGSWVKANPNTGNLITQRGIVYQTWDMVWNYIRRFQDKGVTLELTTNEGHTIHRLNELYALYQKSYSLSGKSNEFEDDRILAFPSGTRGKTAVEVLKQFGSLKNVASASPDELILVEDARIGRKKADSIYNHFNRS